MLVVGSLHWIDTTNFTNIFFVCLQDVSDPEISDSDKCQSYACETGSLEHYNKTESCDCALVSAKAIAIICILSKFFYVKLPPTSFSHV